MKIFAALLSLSAFAAPAFAQTYDPVAPVGPRIEGRVGVDYVNRGLKVSDGTDSFKSDDHATGVVYGGEIGYDLRVAQYATAGVYGGIEGASTKDCAELLGNDEGCIEAGRNFTAGVRVGYMFQPRGLFYVKGGYSNGRIKVGYADFDDRSNDFRLKDDRDGFHLGAGAELGFGRHLYGKVEYVYTNYNSYDFNDGTNRASLDFDRHQVVAGVGLRF